MDRKACHLLNYSGSRDYDVLLQLAREQSIICIVDAEAGESGPVRDIARTLYTPNGREEVFSVMARGTCYIYATEQAEFLSLCEKLNLEFIVPSQSVIKNRHS